MAFRQGLHNFSKGELSKELYGRVDIAPYAAGVRRARNVIIMKYGGLTNRPGTEFIAEAFDGANPVRLLPFQFDDGKSGQNYAMEMGQGYMRLAAGGGMVVEQLLTVLGATNANPVRINIPFHGFAIGDQWAAGGVKGMVELNGRIFTIVGVPDASHFDINADGTAWGVFAGDSDGGVIRSAPPAPPAPAPVIPPVVQPDPPPQVVGGGGGGGGGGIRNCVAVESLILMANRSRDGAGIEKPAGEVRVGEWVWTQHEDTRAWGAFQVERSDVVEEDIWSARYFPDASPPHRFGPDALTGWVRMDELGSFARRGLVWSATIADAHTYMARHPDGGRHVLSHNIKQNQANLE